MPLLGLPVTFFRSPLVKTTSGLLPVPIPAEFRPRDPPLPFKTTLFIERNEKHLLK